MFVPYIGEEEEKKQIKRDVIQPTDRLRGWELNSEMRKM